MQARVNLEAAGSEGEIEEVAADKGYHAAETLELAERLACGRTFPSRSGSTIALDRQAGEFHGRWSTIGGAYRRAKANNLQRRAERTSANGPSLTSATPAA